jgi:hypothetical protein
VREIAAEFAIPVARWSAWPRAGSASAPDLGFVDAPIRRRLSPLARMMLHVAHDCAGASRELRLVFASQHGELGHTVPLLRALAAGEPLSPSTFSLSVHNGAAGLFSIVRGDRSEATALAAGEGTLGQALVEARAQLDADAKPVLVVYGDGKFPDEYAPWADGAQARALALLIERDAPRVTTLAVGPSSEAPRSTASQAEAFVPHLADGSAGGWTGAQRTWSWH